MNRRRFLSGTLAAAPAAALAGQGRNALQNRAQMSAAVTEYSMKEVTAIIVDVRRIGRADAEHVRRTANVLGLLDRHMQETGKLDELEKLLRSGERPEADVDAIASIWERHGLQPNMAVLRRLAKIREEDFERTKSEGISVHNAKLIRALRRRADEMGGRSPGTAEARPMFAESSGDCLDCFCRTLRMEAALLGVAAFFGCVPCGAAAAGLMAIEGVLEYVLQLCSPSECSNADLWNCNSFNN